jgi:hypothetical protein
MKKNNNKNRTVVDTLTVTSPYFVILTIFLERKNLEIHEKSRFKKLLIGEPI